MISINDGSFPTNHIKFVLSIATPCTHFGATIAMSIEVEWTMQCVMWSSFKPMALWSLMWSARGALLCHSRHQIEAWRHSTCQTLKRKYVSIFSLIFLWKLGFFGLLPKQWSCEHCGAHNALDCAVWTLDSRVFWDLHYCLFFLWDVRLWALQISIDTREFVFRQSMSRLWILWPLCVMCTM
jgi:hypothetical protein